MRYLVVLNKSVLLPSGPGLESDASVGCSGVFCVGCVYLLQERQNRIKIEIYAIKAV